MATTYVTFGNSSMIQEGTAMHVSSPLYKLTIYLEQETVKAIVELSFNPGKGVAHLTSTSKRLSSHMPCARTTQETVRVRKQEQALSTMEKTHLLDKLLHLPKGVEVTQHLRGRFIGFVGDRTPMKDPISLVL